MNLYKIYMMEQIKKLSSLYAIGLERFFCTLHANSDEVQLN